jgi:hypothetical protein
LYEKCKIIEDYVYIYVLGPLFKFIIESIPQRNPFCNETEQDLVEFIPETTPQDNLTDDERTFDKDSDCVDWNPNELSNSSSVESLILSNIIN